MVNPVLAARKTLGITQRDLAARSGLSLTTEQNVEQGVTAKIPERILGVLTCNGFNADTLEKEYAMFKAEMEEF